MANEVKEVKVQSKLSVAAYVSIPVAPASELLAELLKKAA